MTRSPTGAEQLGQIPAFASEIAGERDAREEGRLGDANLCVGGNQVGFGLTHIGTGFEERRGQTGRRRRQRQVAQIARGNLEAGSADQQADEVFREARDFSSSSSAAVGRKRASACCTSSCDAMPPSKRVRVSWALRAWLLTVSLVTRSSASMARRFK